MIQPILKTDEHPKTLPLYSRMSDAELVFLYRKNGDNAILETLVIRHAGLVHSVVSRVSVCREDAEDSFQATFMVFAKSLHKIAKVESLPAWLYGVAYRIARRLRSETLGKRKMENLSDREVTSMAPSAVDQVSSIMELEKLDREVNQLPESLRAVIVERYYLGHTLQEISERMEISLSAVDGRLRRARSVLRNRLLLVGLSATALLVHAPSTAIASSVNSELIATTLDRVQRSMQTSSIGGSVSFQKLVQGELAMFSKLKLGMLSIVCGVALLVTTGAIFVYAGQPLTPGDDRTITLSSETATQEATGGTTSAFPVTKTSDAALSLSRETNPFTNTEPNSGSEPDPFGGGEGGTSTPITQYGLSVEAMNRLSLTELNMLKMQHELQLEKSIEVRLMTTMITPDFNNAPLRLVLEQIAEQAGVPIHIDEAIFEELGVGPVDQPITLTLGTELSAGQVLTQLLSKLGVSYQVQNGMVILVDYQDELLIRVYALDDIDRPEEFISGLRRLFPEIEEPVVIGNRVAVSAVPIIHQEIVRILAMLRE